MRENKTAPNILVIIVTWNKKQYVLQLLSSLTGLDYPNAALDILVVDNASSDGTVAALKEQYPHIRLIENQENVGGTGGFNTGMAWAFEQPEERYDYLWLLDNDVMVHRRALSELVDILENNADIDLAGSTMMQLDYPWRINEMGCFFDFANGTLMLNRHLEEIPALMSRPAEELVQDEKLRMTTNLMHCRRFMDVDYAAAASLLVRFKTARKAGLWKDYFIHYDDVEWCLRIAKMGRRVVAAADSLIWHLSAAAKVPTWVLYYDNRNVLETLKTHGADKALMRRAVNYALLKAGYYAVLGKADLSRLHKEAVDDFLARRFGKKDIKLDAPYESNAHIDKVFMDPKIRRILVGPVNFQATGTQAALVKALLQRPELEADFLTLPGGVKVHQVPRSHFVFLPKQRFQRWRHYLSTWISGRYDLVIQSDYNAYPILSWIGRNVLFINDEGFSLRPKPRLHDVLSATWWFLTYRFK